AEPDQIPCLGRERGLEDRHLRRVELVDRGRVRVVGEPAAGTLHVLRRVLEREVDVRAVVEVQIDPDPAFLDLGLELDQLLGRGERRLERLRDRLFQDLGLHALVRDADAHVGIDDRRQQVERQPREEEETEHQHDRRHHEGADRSADREARYAAPSLLPGPALLAHLALSKPGTPSGMSPPTRTSMPSRNAGFPATTTTSPTSRPETISTLPSDIAPVRTGRRRALPSSTTNTDSEPALPSTADAGTRRACIVVFSFNDTRARNPVRASWAPSPSSATSTGTRRVVGSAVGKILRTLPTIGRSGYASSTTFAMSPGETCTTSSSETWTRT